MSGSRKSNDEVRLPLEQAVFAETWQAINTFIGKNTKKNSAERNDIVSRLNSISGQPLLVILETAISAIDSIKADENLIAKEVLIDRLRTILYIQNTFDELYDLDPNTELSRKKFKDYCDVMNNKIRAEKMEHDQDDQFIAYLDAQKDVAANIILGLLGCSLLSKNQEKQPPRINLPEEQPSHPKTQAPVTPPGVSPQGSRSPSPTATPRAVAPQPMPRGSSAKVSPRSAYPSPASTPRTPSTPSPAVSPRGSAAASATSRQSQQGMFGAHSAPAAPSNSDLEKYKANIETFWKMIPAAWQRGSTKHEEDDKLIAYTRLTTALLTIENEIKQGKTTCKDTFTMITVPQETLQRIREKKLTLTAAFPNPNDPKNPTTVRDFIEVLIAVSRAKSTRKATGELEGVLLAFTGKIDEETARLARTSTKKPD